MSDSSKKAEKSVLAAGTVVPSGTVINTVVSPSANPAKWVFERIVHSIKDFEAELDEQHEVGAALVAFASQITFHIADVGYWGPDIIIFYGTNPSGRKVELIQHISQLNVLLVEVEKIEPMARRIGFALVEELEKEKDA